MDLKDVLNKSSEIGDFPRVKISKPIKHFNSNEGKISAITSEGVSVDFGGNWNPWFWFENQPDKRKKYTSELEFID